MMNNKLSLDISASLRELTDFVNTEFCNENDNFSSYIKHNLYFDLIKEHVNFAKGNPPSTVPINSLKSNKNFVFNRDFNDLKQTAEYLEFMIFKANGEIDC